MKSLQLDTPHAIVVIGIQGSGKTFFARKFADTFSAPFIEQSLFDANSASSEASKHLMTTMLTELLKTKRSIVIETTMSLRAERTELVRTLKTAGYTPIFVWVQVDNDTAALRSYRGIGIDGEQHRENIRKFSPPHQAEHALVISGKHTFATQAKIVLKKLSVPRSQPPARQTPVRGQIIVR